MPLNRASVSSPTLCVTLVIAFTNEEFIAGEGRADDRGHHGQECPEKVRVAGSIAECGLRACICLLSARISED